MKIPENLDPKLVKPLEKFKKKWLKMSTEQQFQAAVNIIKGLPKDGPYQPSYDMMLKFYGYYKQATEGPCTQPKPGFWEVVKKAKWEAWSKLGNMSSEEAMTRYVEELKMIIETMSFSADVADFMDTLGPFYEAVNLGEEDGDESETKMITNGGSGSGLDNDDVKSNSLQSKATRLEAKLEDMNKQIDKAAEIMAPDDSEDEDEIYEDPRGELFASNRVDDALRDAVSKLSCDMEHIKARMSTVEKLVQTLDNVGQNKSKRSSFPCQELSGGTVAFVVAWPFVAYALIRLCTKKS